MSAQEGAPVAQLILTMLPVAQILVPVAPVLLPTLSPALSPKGSIRARLEITLSQLGLFPKRAAPARLSLVLVLLRA